MSIRIRKRGCIREPQLVDSVRKLWREREHYRRVSLRVLNCPDKEFKEVWQGGHELDGTPDGADVLCYCTANCDVGCGDESVASELDDK